VTAPGLQFCCTVMTMLLDWMNLSGRRDRTHQPRLRVCALCRNPHPTARRVLFRQNNIPLAHQHDIGAQRAIVQALPVTAFPTRLEMPCGAWDQTFPTVGKLQLVRPRVFAAVFDIVSL
jgi:hypothetical protein